MLNLAEHEDVDQRASPRKKGQSDEDGSWVIQRAGAAL